MLGRLAFFWHGLFFRAYDYVISREGFYKSWTHSHFKVPCVGDGYVLIYPQKPPPTKKISHRFKKKQLLKLEGSKESMYDIFTYNLPLKKPSMYRYIYHTWMVWKWMCTFPSLTPKTVWSDRSPRLSFLPVYPTNQCVYLWINVCHIHLHLGIV